MRHKPPVQGLFVDQLKRSFPRISPHDRLVYSRGRLAVQLSANRASR